MTPTPLRACLLLCTALAGACRAPRAAADELAPLLADLDARGRPPVEFVLARLEAAPGQTMADENDALVFLAPLEHLRQSAAMPGLYGADFQAELARRHRLLRTPEELAEELERAGVESVEALVAKTLVEWPESPVPPVE